jgi:hypothetical protein
MFSFFVTLSVGVNRKCDRITFIAFSDGFWGRNIPFAQRIFAMAVTHMTRPGTWLHEIDYICVLITYSRRCTCGDSVVGIACLFCVLDEFSLSLWFFSVNDWQLHELWRGRDRPLVNLHQKGSIYLAKFDYYRIEAKKIMLTVSVFQCLAHVYMAIWRPTSY